MNKESIVIPKLTNFKIKKPKIVNPVNSKIINSWYLNIFLIIFFIIFLMFFLYNCKDGMFSGFYNEPVPYSLIYNLKG